MKKKIFEALETCWVHRSQLSLLVGEALASPGEAFSKNGLPWGGLSVKIARCTVGVKSYDLLASGYYSNNMI